MYIARSMAFLPYVSVAALVIALILLEVKAWKETAAEEPEPEPGRNGFVVPPGGEGYEYYVNANNIVFILQKAKKRFRVYLMVADATPHVTLKHDKYGRYFNCRAADSGEVERIVDAAFEMRGVA